MEKEAVAKKLDEETIDLLTATSIVVDKDLGKARKVEKLTLEIRGLAGTSIDDAIHAGIQQGSANIRNLKSLTALRVTGTRRSPKGGSDCPSFVARNRPCG